MSYTGGGPILRGNFDLSQSLFVVQRFSSKWSWIARRYVSFFHMPGTDSTAPQNLRLRCDGPGRQRCVWQEAREQFSLMGSLVVKGLFVKGLWDD